MEDFLNIKYYIIIITTLLILAIICLFFVGGFFKVKKKIEKIFSICACTFCGFMVVVFAYSIYNLTYESYKYWAESQGITTHSMNSWDLYLLNNERIKLQNDIKSFKEALRNQENIIGNYTKRLLQLDDQFQELEKKVRKEN